MTRKALKNGLQTGITFSIIIIFLILIGFTVTGSALVSKILGTQVPQASLPSVDKFVIFICLIGILEGITAARRESESYFASILAGLTAGLLTGLISGGFAYWLGKIYSEGVDFRNYLSAVSPASVQFLNFNQDPLKGALHLLGLLAVSALLGGLISGLARSKKRQSLTDSISKNWHGYLGQSNVIRITSNKYLRFGLLGLVLIGLAFLPTQWGSYWNYVMGTVGIYVILGLGLNIIVGLAGQLVLGYVAFYAMGAYTLALLNAPQPHNLMWGFWIGLVLAIILSAITGILIGLPILSLRGDYLAIVTLGFGEIIRILLQSDMMTSLTGGPRGVLNISGPVILGHSFTSDVDFMYLIIIAVVITVFITQRVQNSNTGRSWVSIREDEVVAKATGVDTFKSKLLALALGAAFAGIGGALFASRSQSTGPEDYSLMVSINVLAVVIVGGMGSVPGIILGSFVLKGLPEILRELDNYRLLVFGALLIVMMIIRPEGIWPAKRRSFEKVKEKEVVPEIVSEDTLRPLGVLPEKEVEKP
jgi:ABC-type branched-subunit amino acid transport system permease subunit